MENRLEILRNKINSQINHSDMCLCISHVYGAAKFCTLLAMKRNMNIELAATCGMLHDIHWITGGSIDNHAAKGAAQAETILKSMNLYSDDEIKTITSAISNHSDKSNVHDPYSEMLKDADVLDHCFYNVDFPIADKEIVRYKNLLLELGITPNKHFT
jgi:uncharacterized protein